MREPSPHETRARAALLDYLAMYLSADQLASAERRVNAYADAVVAAERLNAGAREAHVRQEEREAAGARRIIQDILDRRGIGRAPQPVRLAGDHHGT